MTINDFDLSGSIRVFPRDFVVEEVWNGSVCKIEYPLADRLRDRYLTRNQREKDYLHFTLVKEDWDTFRALNRIRRRLDVSLKRFGFSGMKDKRAVTAQRVSLWKGRRKSLVHLRLKDLLLKDFEYSDSRINLGNAIGNRFTITIREIPMERGEVADILNRFKEQVTSRGIPNYFGPQRLRGGNAEVGEALKAGDLRRGVDLILDKVKGYLEDGGISRIPKVLWYEKKMVRHLTKHPNDYAGALRKIPKKILTLYVHAYQSRLFNERLEHDLKEHRVPRTITILGFTTPKIPELRTFPFERRSFLTTSDFQVVRIDDGLAILRFVLAKGEYASTLLSNLNVC